MKQDMNTNIRDKHTYNIFSMVTVKCYDPDVQENIWISLECPLACIDIWSLIITYKCVIPCVMCNLSLFLLSFVCLMVFNVTFSNISAISWRSVLLVEETGVPGENQRPVESHRQTLLHNVVHLALIEILTHNISGDRHWFLM
jgi:hypothetical protein